MKTTFNILTILFLIIVSGDLFACTCIGDMSVKDEIKKSDAVFVGTNANCRSFAVLTGNIFTRLFPETFQKALQVHDKHRPQPQSAVGFLRNSKGM